MAFFCALVLGGVATYIGFWFSSSQKMDAPGETFIVQQGWAVQTIADELEAKNLISHPRLFSAMSRILGDSKRIHAGEYILSASMSPAKILSKFVDGDVVLHRVTLPEGMTSVQFIEMLSEIPELKGEVTVSPPEGSLLPETYSFQHGTDRSVVVKDSQEKMSELVNQLWEQRPQDTPLKSKEEFLTLASIVEKETASPEERPLVAAVFINRLKIGMPLQADPTVLYGLTQGKKSLGRRLLRSDLQTPNPYNTYLNPGLPPGPIANPGEASLRAVLNPAPVDYLYFVANGPNSHIFSSTLAEHKRNHSNWREIRKNLESQSSDK